MLLRSGLGDPDAAALAVLLLPAAAASAQPAESATLTMVSDPGDYIGQGQTWSYATEAGDGTVSRITGRATVHGTVSCTEPVTVVINGTLIQVKKKTILSGPLSTQVACTSGAPVSWQAVAIPNGTTPFDRGDAEVEVTASAQDPNFGGTVAVSQTQVVRLQKA